MTEQPLWWPAWTLGDMIPVSTACLTCGDPIRLSGGTGARIWTHNALRVHMHNALPAPSLIADLVDISITERTEES